MGIIKLQEAGDSLTATIKHAERVKGQYGEQVKFSMEQGDLYVPLDSALRQLERIPIAIEACAGETLTFSRDPNNSRPGAKPYWGIRLAGGAEKQAMAQPSKRLPPPEARKPLPFDMDEFPSEEYGQGVADPYAVIAGIENVSAAESAKLMDAYADPRPLPPFHRPPATKAGEVAPNAAKRATLFDEYMALTAQVRKHSGHTSDDAIQATTFSIFKMWKDAGLV